jgi:rubrerythrin
MVETDETIREILRKAYQIEVDGYTFYSMAADRAAKPAVQELFDKLARDEVEHKAYLRDIMRGYEERGLSAFQVDRRNPEMQAFTATIFTDEFKKQAAGADFEIGVLSIGMQLETNAIGHFTRAAKSATENEVREFYTFLADWEKQHLEALQGLFNAVRQDFWSEGRFSPF